MKDSNRSWIPFGFLVLLVAVVVFVGNRGREPVIQGKRLSAWLEDCNLDTTELGSAAAEVIRQSGPQALPTIQQLLRTRDSSLKRRLMGDCIEFRAFHCRVTSAYCYQVRAAAACRILGPGAEVAIPELVSLVQEGAAARSAGEALAAIGPKALSALIAQLRGNVAAFRAAAAAAVGQFGTNGIPALDALTEAAADPEPLVRTKAILALHTVGNNGDPRAVAALIKALADTDAKIRRYAVTILGTMGLSAQPALPALQATSNDPDPEVRRLSQITLKCLQQSR